MRDGGKHVLGTRCSDPTCGPLVCPGYVEFTGSPCPSHLSGTSSPSHTRFSRTSRPRSSQRRWFSSPPSGCEARGRAQGPPPAPTRRATGPALCPRCSAAPGCSPCGRHRRPSICASWTPCPWMSARFLMGRSGRRGGHDPPAPSGGRPPNSLPAWAGNNLVGGVLPRELDTAPMFTCPRTVSRRFTRA